MGLGPRARDPLCVIRAVAVASFLVLRLVAATTHPQVTTTRTLEGYFLGTAAHWEGHGGERPGGHTVVVARTGELRFDRWTVEHEGAAAGSPVAAPVGS